MRARISATTSPFGFAPCGTGDDATMANGKSQIPDGRRAGTYEPRPCAINQTYRNVDLWVLLKKLVLT
jgi:hypothetical protein